MLQLFGIARAVAEAAASEDTKVSRTKPLPGLQIHRGPSLHRRGRRRRSSLQAHEESPAQGEVLEQQGCPTALPPLPAGEEGWKVFSVPKQETVSHLIGVI